MFRIKIGRCVSQIDLTPREREGEYREMFSGFLTDGPPDCQIYARLIDNFRRDDYSRYLQVVRAKKDIYLLNWYYLSGRFDEKRGIVRAELSSMPHVLPSLLRMVYGIKIVKKGGIFIHAASFVRDNVAYIFAGRSGAGKTTLARIVMKADPTIEILSDEISYIAVEENGVYAYSTPFWGSRETTGRYLKAPLKVIFFINKAKRNSTQLISRSEFVQNMLANVLFASIDCENLLLGLNTINRIIKETECKVLNFRKDASFLEVI